MNDFTRPTAYYGQSSTVSRMQQQYWTTKQAFFRKIGRKEDDCIIASDAELDAKLELFGAIQDSCSNLLRVLEGYQDRILALSQEENALGRFLKECGKQDKTRAGKMMGATGRTMSHSAQQRLTLRLPLVRLYQEVETYQCRAVADTLCTVRKMERSRTDYRGALLWMKDISQQLDPDTYKQLEKFRKVQGHVKRTKMQFEKLKLDTLQKVDLLAASRCNMFSHVLATYQGALLAFWEKTSSTMTNVAESFRGYQHYDFVVVKELQEPSRKLAQEMGNGEDKGSREDNDRMLLAESEYRDEEGKRRRKKASPGRAGPDDVPLLSLDSTLDSTLDSSLEGKLDSNQDGNLGGNLDGNLGGNLGGGGPVLPAPGSSDWDLLSAGPSEGDDLALLSALLLSPESLCALSSEEGLGRQWRAAFGEPLADSPAATPADAPPADFLPSQLLDLESAVLTGGVDAPSLEPLKPAPKPAPLDKPFRKDKKDMSAWFNLFADLDPLANPDAIGKKPTEEDRNC